MIIKNIKTERKYQTWPSYDLVYEWEDIIKQELGCNFSYRNLLVEKFFKRIPITRLLDLFQSKSFQFHMTPQAYGGKRNLPCIIDFFETTEKFEAFEQSYRYSLGVFISSKEAYDKLKENGCKLNIHHLPLSISDKYKFNKEVLNNKKYDLVLMGRQNPVLESYLERYKKEHADFTYVYRKQLGKEFWYFTSDGENLGDINTREKYIALMKQSRSGLYATPGIDGGEKRTNGYNQVTPRFLELIACGCHVIARYPKNSDTDYYEINKFSPNIDSYELFKKKLDEARNTPIDSDLYSNYLSNHYTSVRVNQLKEILKQL